MRRVGEAISLHTRQHSQSPKFPKYYRCYILIFPRVPRLVPETVYKDLRDYSTCPSHAIIFRNTPSGNPTIPHRTILRDHRCSYFVRWDKLYRTASWLEIDALDLGDTYWSFWTVELSLRAWECWPPGLINRTWAGGGCSTTKTATFHAPKTGINENCTFFFKFDEKQDEQNIITRTNAHYCCWLFYIVFGSDNARGFVHAVRNERKTTTHALPRVIRRILSI